MNGQTLRLAVFASGSGSNFQAIIDAAEQGSLPAELALCLSNKETAGALERARQHGIATAVLSPESFLEEAQYAATLLDVLERHGVNFVALAGFMKRIPPAVVSAFHHRMTNIHPALLPAFGGHGMYGIRVHRAVLEYGARWTGVTVHLVDEDYDTGPIVLQQPVPVQQDDSPETLAARVLEAEHRLYPEALRLFAENRVTVEGRRVVILPDIQPPTRT
jgi:phosphoribosylglycinamide formyltransferase 1